MTCERVPAGTPIWTFQPGFDTRHDPAQFQQLPRLAQRFLRHYAYLDHDTGEWVLNGDDARFMNHSDTPNTGLRPGGEADAGGCRTPESYLTVALLDLVPGTELTCNYREFDADARWKLGGG